MRRLLPFSLLGVLLPFLGVGCGVAQPTAYTYSVQIETSENATDGRIVSLATPDTTMDALLHDAGIQTALQPRGTEMHVTSLDGVIATLSKEWHLYINNTLTPLTQLEAIPVHASDTIEWKYEPPIQQN
jgi:hypothetical protein